MKIVQDEQNVRRQLSKIKKIGEREREREREPKIQTVLFKDGNLHHHKLGYQVGYNNQARETALYVIYISNLF